jgi:hypothetical protein
VFAGLHPRHGPFDILDSVFSIVEQLYTVIILSIVVASIAWTVTQEEIFREPREFCARCSEESRNFVLRKFFYVFTCEYCFSHWVTLGLLILTGFKLAIDDWRGYVLAFFVTNWLANQWMSLYRRLRVEIKKENIVAEEIKKKV